MLFFGIAKFKVAYTWCSKIFIERARLAVLAWGDEQHISDLQKQYSGGFDIILGADIVYVEEFVPHLFKTARALISPTKQAIFQSNLVKSLD